MTVIFIQQEPRVSWMTTSSYPLPPPPSDQPRSNNPHCIPRLALQHWPCFRNISKVAIHFTHPPSAKQHHNIDHVLETSLKLQFGKIADLDLYTSAIFQKRWRSCNLASSKHPHLCDTGASATPAMFQNRRWPGAGPGTEDCVFKIWKLFFGIL